MNRYPRLSRSVGGFVPAARGRYCRYGGQAAPIVQLGTSGVGQSILGITLGSVASIEVAKYAKLQTMMTRVAVHVKNYHERINRLSPEIFEQRQQLAQLKTSRARLQMMLPASGAIQTRLMEEELRAATQLPKIQENIEKIEPVLLGNEKILAKAKDQLDTLYQFYSVWLNNDPSLASYDDL